MANITKRPNILVVDDQPTNILAVNEMLSPDYDIFMATTGGEALAICLQETPDLVLLDVNMPELDGFLVCETLKQRRETRNIPVIFITGSDRAEDETRGLEVGAVDFISKPINPAVLRARVKTHLILKSQADSLRAQALTDELTGIANRRRFDQHFDLEWRACRRGQVPLGVLILDVDHFKAYNDYYGHQAGDEALRLVAQVLDKSLRRPRDFVARYGGEEFACVFPFSSLDAVSRAAALLCSRIREAAIPHAASAVTSIVTISAGAAVQVPGAGDSSKDLLRLADANLYQAKRAGRDRVHASTAARKDEAELSPAD